MFRFPVGVMKKIENIHRNFLWGWGSEGRKIAWVSWKKVCETKGEGGLGVINVKDFNLALLSKWISRLGSNEGGLWEEVLESKYGGWRNLKEDKGSSYESLWWKDLKRIWQLQKWGNNFGDCLKWEIGNGKSIRFWEDRWTGNDAFKSTLITEKEASLDSCGSRKNFGWEWSLGWRRNLLDWEQVEKYFHLFFIVGYLGITWNLCYAWLGITTIVHFHAFSHFLQFRLCNAPESVNLGLDNIWIAMVSEIWRHKNKIVFNEGILDFSEIFSLAQLKVWAWLSSKFLSASFFFSDWYLAPLVCLYSL